MKELLNCSSCELGAEVGGSMCGVVAMRTVREMVKVGYDTSSDMRSAGEIVEQQIASSPDVRNIAEAECQLRLLQHQSVQQGYGTVIY